MEELRQVAYFVIISEVWVDETMPPDRLNNFYCINNIYNVGSSTHSRNLGVICDSLRKATNPEQLCSFMQRDRYCRWNFENTLPTKKKGTIEFRGGRHVRGKVMTKRWIVFTITFVSLAIEKASEPIWKSPPGIELIGSRLFTIRLRFIKISVHGGMTSELKQPN